MPDKAIQRWKENERPVKLTYRWGPRTVLTASWLCPGCEQEKEYDYTEGYGYHLCSCGTRVLLDYRPTLTELEPDA